MPGLRLLTVRRDWPALGRALSMAALATSATPAFVSAEKLTGNLLAWASPPRLGRVVQPAFETECRMSATGQDAAHTTSTATIPTAPMPAVLNYFGFPARGEATRVALAVGGNAFEDKRLTREEFEASSFKSLPVFQLDGTDYTQSLALLRYAGKIGGLYPEDPLAALKVDEIVLIAEDVFINLFSTVPEQDEAKKMEKCRALMAGKVKNLLENIALKLAANTASPFCVGDSLTIADIQIHAVIATVETGFLQGFPPTMVGDICPSLKTLDKAVMEHPKVKAYYASKA